MKRSKWVVAMLAASVGRSLADKPWCSKKPFVYGQLAWQLQKRFGTEDL